jgi:hypothetical protein
MNPNGEYILSNLESKEIQCRNHIFLLGQSFTLVLMNQLLLCLSLKVLKNQVLSNLYHPAAPPALMFTSASFRV